jgi:cytochrome P450
MTAAAWSLTAGTRISEVENRVDVWAAMEERLMATPTGSDLFRSLFEGDPHEVYARLRADGPVRSIALPTGATGWLVTRYDDVRRALADPRLSKGGIVAPVGYRPPDVSPETLAGTQRHMLTTDPPQHARLRRLVAAAFTMRRVEKLRPRIQEITNELLDAMAGQDAVDLVSALAFPLPIRVIGQLLGVPAADQDSFRAWSAILVAGIHARDDLPGAFDNMLGYIRDLIEIKRANPGDDLLSALLAASEDGDRLTDNELTSTVFLLLIAGHETTANLIANGTYLLLSQREQWELLRVRPDLLPRAVEELLRYESPVHCATHRVATNDVTLGGQLIPAGATVLISLLSANRDEQHIAGAGHLDVTRPATPHVAFGHGIHFCLGAPLARLEGQVAFGSLLVRYPRLRLAEPHTPPAWRPGALMHGLASLPVRVG